MKGFPSRSTGGIYLALLILVAVLALQATLTLSAGAAAAHGDAEAQLLEVGEDLERALASYAAVGGGGGPRDWEALLRDPRFPGVRRHLRQIPIDPLTGRPEWGTVLAPDGSILGFHSLAPGIPIRQSGFKAEHQRFESAQTYADWRFMAPSRRPLPPSSR